MRTAAAALASGALFGVGLAWSGMTNPARVLGFLDVAGNWDATLLLVMAAALAVAMPAFRRILRLARPRLAASFRLPGRTRLDLPLLAGAAIFGVGWGLGGLCPGPALAGLVTGAPGILVFVAAMVAGQWLAARLERRG